MLLPPPEALDCVSEELSSVETPICTRLISSLKLVSEELSSVETTLETLINLAL